MDLLGRVVWDVLYVAALALASIGALVLTVYVFAALVHFTDSVRPNLKTKP